MNRGEEQVRILRRSLTLSIILSVFIFQSLATNTFAVTKQTVGVVTETNEKITPTSQNEITSPTTGDTITINFPESNLELAIRDKLNKHEGDISSDEVLTITELEIYNGYLSNLEGLQYLKNLTSLKLNYSQISDISLLSYLKSLTRLELKNNQISDISPLRSLSNLKNLYLQNNNISDISNIADLTQLEELYLSGNNVKNYSPVQSYYNISVA